MAAKASGLDSNSLELLPDSTWTGFGVEDLGYRVAGREILAGITATFEPGRLYGIIGPNGAGKSTLLKLLARQIRPSGGAASFDGRPLSDWPGRNFAREVAYLPQFLQAAQHHTVRELVALGRYPWHGPFGRLSADDRAAIDEALHDTDGHHHEDRLVGTLSGGERQRAWIAMVLAQARRFLLLDEPISALDIAHQAKLLSLLKKLVARRGIGVVLVLHDINIAAQFCDRILALRDGRLIAFDTPDAIVTTPILSRLYDIDMQVFAHPANGRPIGYIAS